MRVAVTGADGFTGRYLLAALAAEGHDAIILAADITDADAIAAELSTARPDAVIHLAAQAFVHVEGFADFYAVNQIGTFNLLSALAAVRPGATALIASSAQVYGGASGLLDEEQPLAPVNHYAASKAAMELGTALWADKLKVLIARPFNYTGVGQEERYLIPKIVAHLRRRAPIIELGNIDVKRDIGDVRSVVSAYCGLLSADADERVFNVCSQRLCSVRDILAIGERITGHSIEVVVNPAFVRANDPAVLSGNNARLRSVLPDWQPQPIEETLRWMLA